MSSANKQFLEYRQSLTNTCWINKRMNFNVVINLFFPPWIWLCRIESRSTQMKMMIISRSNISCEQLGSCLVCKSSLFLPSFPSHAHPLLSGSNSRSLFWHSRPYKISSLLTFLGSLLYQRSPSWPMLQSHWWLLIPLYGSCRCLLEHFSHFAIYFLYECLLLTAHNLFKEGAWNIFVFLEPSTVPAML